MAMTAAQRQKRYRDSRSTADQGEGERRLNTWISTKAAIALQRITAHEGASKRAIIERLILKADDDLQSTFGSNDKLFEQYIEAPLKKRPDKVKGWLT